MAEAAIIGGRTRGTIVLAVVCGRRGPSLKADPDSCLENARTRGINHLLAFNNWTDSVAEAVARVAAGGMCLLGSRQGHQG